MRLRAALFIAAGALVLSFVIPGLVALGLTEILPRILGNEGWMFITYLGVALIVGHWTQGMLWGVALLVPLSAILERLAPNRVNGRKVLIYLLVVWMLPAMPVSLFVQPAVARFRLTRPDPSECIAGVTISNFELSQREGKTAIFGYLSNMGELRLTSLEAEFMVRPAPDGPDKRGLVSTVLCDVVQREVWDRPDAKPVTLPRTFSRFRCEVPGIEARANPPSAEFVRFRSWGCVELGDRLYN
jgi:hypothetical protein